MSQKLALDCIDDLNGFAKNEKIGHQMTLSRAILGKILAILRILAHKNDQPVFEGKSLLLP